MERTRSSAVASARVWSRCSSCCRKKSSSRHTTTGATRTSVSATIPVKAKASRVWNDWGTDGRRRSSPRPAPAAGWLPSAMSVLGELVARAAHGQHELRQRRVVLDLVAQVAHVDVDRLLVLVERLVVPQELEQLAPAEDASGPAGEMPQDLELRRGEPDSPVAALDAPSLEVDDE